MQTVVLAAGHGTRMRPLTDNRPKPLLPVGDKPLVAHTLDAAIDAGASDIVLVIGYRGDQIRERIGHTYRNTAISYVEQSDPLGTAHAVKMANSALRAEPFAILNGDVIYDAASLDSLFENGPAVASYRVDNPSDYGVLFIENGTVTGVVEKPEDPPSDRINAGAYVFPASARDWLDVDRSERGEYELTDVLERVCDEHHVRPITLDWWLDVGRPWELLVATEGILRNIDRQIEGTVSQTAEIEGPVIIEPGATIRAGSVIEGPAIIRSGASIGPNAYIRGSTVIGENASVGNACEIKNSIIMPHAAVNHLSYVGDSVLGESVNFGAGTIVANLRHDGNPVKCTVRGERVSTGRRKFGVVIGDGAKTAIGTSLNAGVTLSGNATTSPGEVVTRDR